MLIIMNIWSSSLGEFLRCRKHVENENYIYAVVVEKEDSYQSSKLVGHVQLLCSMSHLSSWHSQMRLYRQSWLGRKLIKVVAMG